MSETQEILLHDTDHSLRDVRVSITIKQLIDQNHILMPQVHPQFIFQIRLLDYTQAEIPPSFTNIYTRNLISQKLTFPITYRDLSYGSFFAISIWSMGHSTKIPLASTTISVFKSNLTLRVGPVHLVLWPDCYPDTSNEQLTPGIIDLRSLKVVNNCSKSSQKLQMTQMKSLMDCKLIQINKTEQIYEYKAFPVAYLQVQFQNYQYPVIYKDSTAFQFEQTFPHSQTFDSCIILYDHQYQQQIQNPLKKLYFQQKRNIPDAQLLIPNKQQQSKILQLAKKPAHLQMSQQEKLLFYRFRYSLLKHPQYLIKFVHAVNWQVQQQVQNSMLLLKKWQTPPITDILCLLSSSFSANKLFQQKVKGPIPVMIAIRRLAVQMLKLLQSSQILTVLLQLVQALKYESQQGDLHKLLIQRALTNKKIANNLYWYLSVQTELNQAQKKSKDVMLHNELQKYYLKIFTLYKLRLKQSSLLFQMMNRQQKLRQQLGAINKKFKDPKISHKPKQAQLTQLRKLLLNIDLGDGVEFALDPQLILIKVVPQKCRVFISAMAPFLLTFQTKQGKQVRFMYKNGDDLRQDQLVMQLFIYMDRALKSVNQDYQLITYKILAFNRKQGFLQFVPNTITLQDVLYVQKLQVSKYLQRLSTDHDNPIYKKIQKKQPPSLKPQQISSKARKQINQHYMKSCAGYCALTYFVGIGDRHLQNLLLDNYGRLFHIDFGFIFGADPKPYPSPIKLTENMIEGMIDQTQFKIKCNQAVIYLRKRSRQIISLVQMMMNSGLKDLTKQSLNKMVGRFKLEKNDKQAQKQFLGVLDSSLRSIWSGFNDNIHRIAVNIRAS